MKTTHTYATEDRKLKVTVEIEDSVPVSKWDASVLAHFLLHMWQKYTARPIDAEGHTINEETG